MGAARKLRRILGRAVRSETASRFYLMIFKTTAVKQKEDWEFEWQERQWSSLFSQPENQRKVEEYWIRYRHLDDIRRLVPMDQNSTILDVGCGLSTVLHYLPGHRYGIDPLAERYKTIYRYPDDIDIRRAYGESIPFSDAFFDVAFCSNCIDHTANPRLVVQEVRRVLKPGGHFILTCETFAADKGRREAGHPYSMTLAKLQKLVENFQQVQQWRSPWLGQRRYVLGEPATDQQEYIFLLRKP
ncbi:MAG TPA: class I SAM-dependent methyltransferase [Terriglobia bacterium]|nr:class I SAM-dependent methyltransferase [Terriglobia bacterium]